MTHPNQSNTRIKMRISIFFILVFFAGSSYSDKRPPMLQLAPKTYNGNSKSAVDVGFDDEEVFFVSVTSDACLPANRENAII